VWLIAGIAGLLVAVFALQQVAQRGTQEASTKVQQREALIEQKQAEEESVAAAAAKAPSERISVKEREDLGPDWSKETPTDTVEGTDVPGDFPEDVPVYTGDVVSSSTSSQSWTLTIYTKDSPQKVLGYYVEELGAAGWEKKADMVTPGGGLYEGRNAGRSVTIVITKGGGKGKKANSVKIVVDKP
jgi:hypothetical protein